MPLLVLFLTAVIWPVGNGGAIVLTAGVLLSVNLAYAVLHSMAPYGTLLLPLLSALASGPLAALVHRARQRVPLLVMGRVLRSLGVNAALLAFLGALVTLNRRLLDELLYLVKRELTSAGEGDQEANAVAAGQALPSRARHTNAQLFCLALLAIATAIGLPSPAGSANRDSGFVNAMNHGAICDGVVDDTGALQKSINALSAAGGIVYIPPSPSGTRCTFSATLTLPDGAKILGAGKWATILRYTGPDAAFAPGGRDNRRAAFEDFTLQLTGAAAAGIDAARLISSTFRSIRIAWAGPNVGGTGIRAVIRDTAWTSYFNVLEDVTFDGLRDGILIDSSVAQAANRWRIIAATILAPQAINTSNGIVLNRVQGIDILGPYCDQIGGACIKLGAEADRVTVVAGRLETAYGGSMFSIHPAANRTTILGYQVHSGATGTVELGTRASLLGQWGDERPGTRGTPSASTAPSGSAMNRGIVANRAVISGAETTNRVTFETPEPDTNYVPVITPCGVVGSAPLGSNRLWVSDLKVSGFTIHAESAPGPGNTITVCWHRLR